MQRRAAAWLVALGIALVVCAPAQAQQVGPDEPDGSGTDTFVTIAARECDNYTDVRANLARNDIMESLQDLGPDTLYSPGDQIDPRTEAAGQPACRPLVGWRFTLGSGYQTQAVSGVWGSLSKVIEPGHHVDRHPGVGAGARLSGRGAERAADRGGDDDRVEPTTSSRAAAATRSGCRAASPTTRCSTAIRSSPAATGSPRSAARSTTSTATTSRRSSTRPACATCSVTRTTSRRRRAAARSSSASRCEGDGAYAESFPFSGNVSYNPGGAFDLDARSGVAGQQHLLPRRDAAGRRPVDGDGGRAGGLGADRAASARRARARCRPTSGRAGLDRARGR